MNVRRTLILFLILALCAATSLAQDRTKGGIKGRVRVEAGTPDHVDVIVRRNDQEVARTVTDNKGDFQITNLTPGTYGLTFRKPGLAVGNIERVEVVAGKVRGVGGRLTLSVDQGSIAFVRGSVFNDAGRSIGGVRVELARVQPDGTARKIAEQYSSPELGEFVFRLPPDAAKYRVTARAEGAEPVSKEVEVDGAAVYRVGLTIKPNAR